MNEERAIRARANGPWLVPGPIQVRIEADETRKVDQEVVALCRCGGSGDKPFCDGAHKRNGYIGPEVVLHLG